MIIEESVKVLNRCNEIRIKALRKVTWVSILILAFIVGIAYLGIFETRTKDQTGVLMGVATMILFFVVILVVWIPSIVKDARDSIKRIAVSNALEKSVTEFKLEPRRKIGNRLFNQAGLFKLRANLMFGGDLISGKRNNTAFALSDLRALRRVTDGDSTSTTNVFKGLYFTIENKEDFPRTLITNEKRTKFNLDELTEYMLDESEFDFFYSDITIAEDKKEVLLYAAKEISEVFKKKIALLFDGNYIYVTVFTKKNFFEPPFFKKIKQERIEEIFSEILQCILVIDILNQKKNKSVQLNEK